MDLSTGCVPLGPSTARTARHVILVVRAWLQQLFNAAEVCLCVHQKDKTVQRYLIKEDGSAAFREGQTSGGGVIWPIRSPVLKEHCSRGLHSRHGRLSQPSG